MFTDTALCRPGIPNITQATIMKEYLSVDGDGRTIRLKFEPCASWSPHEAGIQKVGKREKPCPVQCNRPYGHDGNHMCLNGAFDRLAEWGLAEVIR